MFKLPLRPSLAIKNIQSALICVSFKAPGTYYGSTLDYISFGAQNHYGEYEIRMENHLAKCTGRS